LSYSHLTLDERKYLQQLLSEGCSLRKIAAVLERSPSTISREIRRNRSKYRPHHQPDNPYWYNHWRAQNLYIRRRRAIVRNVLVPGSVQWDYIVSGLQKFWSPEAICGRWHRDFPMMKKLCFSTIYRYLAQGKFAPIHANSHLRRRGKRFVSRASCYNTIQPEHLIPQWPDVIKNRHRIGDWEGDTVYGGIGKGLLVTLVDRKSRLLRMGLLHSRNAQETKRVITHLLSDLPVKSISLDNGSEFSEFRAVEKELNTTVYFAQPHHPWQRGTNENTNDIIRYFFPKGCDFHSVSATDVLAVEFLLNSRPRKCLHWQTPLEVFLRECVALA